ncbi:hypothetical protein [Dactylosporangium sp. CA-092794]|uniref:hypothetical protein n=1 Tax=Dactylosporangium sp. CA-092794 TaxID=3239929 RepID=UPI003D94513E
MKQVSGVRAVVEGDLPADVMERIAASVRRAVLHELAELDLAPRPAPTPAANKDLPDLETTDIGLPTVIPFPLGIWFKPDEPLLVAEPDGTPGA